jgi:hypothetical protein
LLQNLSNAGSTIASSPAVLSALEKAPTSDIVQLSTAATQLESVDALFGISNGSSTSTPTPLANLESLLSGSGTTSNESEANQLASYQAASQLANAQSLFGAPTTPNLNNSLLNVLY